MKKFAALMMLLLCALMICTIPALAANESGSDSNVTETVSVTAGSNDNDVTSAKAMGSGAGNAVGYPGCNVPACPGLLPAFAGAASAC